MNAGINYSIDILMFGRVSDEAQYNTFGFTALRANGKNILIDCGSDMDDKAKQSLYFDLYMQSRDALGRPQDALATIGLKAEDVTDIILTHAHMDHMGAVDLFPNAHFYLQETELVGWEEIVGDSMMAPVFATGVVDPEDLRRARALVDANRMTLIDGDVKNLLPGIDVFAFDNAHSIRDQVVVVNTPDGPYICIGDLATREGHIMGTEEKPFYDWHSTTAGSLYRTAKAFKRLKAMVDNDMDRIIMPHNSEYETVKQPVFSEGPILRFKIR